MIHYFNRNYPQVEVQIFDGNYDEIRDWIIHGQVDCGFLSSIVADNLKFYPLCEDPLCAVMQKNHPLAEKKSVRLEELLEYPFIIETRDVIMIFCIYWKDVGRSQRLLTVFVMIRLLWHL